MKEVNRMTWTCPYCGKPNLMSHSHCNRCGTSKPANLRSAAFIKVSPPVASNMNKR